MLAEVELVCTGFEKEGSQQEPMEKGIHLLTRDPISWNQSEERQAQEPFGSSQSKT